MQNFINIVHLEPCVSAKKKGFQKRSTATDSNPHTSSRLPVIQINYVGFLVQSTMERMGNDIDYAARRLSGKVIEDN